MIEEKLANTILLRVLFGGLKFDGTVQGKPSGHFVVIPGNRGPRWIVPKDPRLGSNVLAQWRPYGIRSQFKWYLLRALYSLRVICRVPGVSMLRSNEVSYLRIPGQAVDIVPIIYVGSPGPQQKAVVTLVNSSNGAPVAVMKVALEMAARASLLQEVKVLQLLNRSGVKNVPKFLGFDEDAGRTWQSLISGRLASRRLTHSHIDWLLKLPSSGKTTTPNELNRQLCHLYEKKADCSTFKRQIIEKAMGYIKGPQRIPLVLVHGDFAPWNIKKQTNGELAVIDWEDAQFDGFPLMDLCHFYFIQGHLFSRSDAVKEIFSSSLVDRYLEEIGAKASAKALYVLLYLLFMAIREDRNTTLEYRAFLIDQIPKVLAN